MFVDILDCLKRVRYNKRFVKIKEKKRKLIEKDWDFNKKNYIVYFNDLLVEKIIIIIKEEEDLDNLNSVLIFEFIVEDV